MGKTTKNNMFAFSLPSMTNRIFAKNGYLEKMRAWAFLVFTLIFSSGRIVWAEFWPFYVFSEKDKWGRDKCGRQK